MDEVDVDAVDLGDELRQSVEPRLDAPEVVFVEPIPRELLHHRQLDALRAVGDELPVGPARRRDAPAEVVQYRLPDLEREGANLGPGGELGAAHIDLRWSRSGGSGAGQPTFARAVALERAHCTARRNRP